VKTYIYTLKCPITGKVRYVGKTNNPTERYKNHINKARDGGTHKRNWINLLRIKNLKPIFEIIDEVSVKEWKDKEKYYIKHYIDKGYYLVNHTGGGDGLSFGNQTSFKKGCISMNKGTGAKKKCKVCGKEFPCAPSYFNRYYCCSKECRKIYVSNNLNKGTFKKGIVPWNKGKQLSKNTVNSKPVIQTDIKTDKIINRFLSAAEAERQLGINQDNITNNTNGRSKSAGGFKWKKEKD